MEGKVLGKIVDARFGLNDDRIGFTFDLAGPSFSTTDFWGYWAVVPTSNTQWTNAERVQHLGNMVMDVCRRLRSAKVENLSDLIGKPVEVELENNMIKSWRILVEVL